MISKRNALGFLIGIALFTQADHAQGAFPESPLDPGVLDLAVKSLGKYCEAGPAYQLSEFTYMENEFDQGQWEAVYSLSFQAIDSQDQLTGGVKISIVKSFHQNPRVSPLALTELSSKEGLCSYPR